MIAKNAKIERQLSLWAEIMMFPRPAGWDKSSQVQNQIDSDGCSGRG
jgi:uncharacterized protein YbdZ (MbtH family)